MRFGPGNTKVITITLIGALKFMMWSRVATLSDVTGSYTIKEAAWVNERSGSLFTAMFKHDAHKDIVSF